VPLTFVLAVVLSAAISLLLGQPEVATQTLIFSTPTLQIVALPVVSTATAVAEEFIFRGSLYNALLTSGAS
jgi:membrane protease YdiL (CAAX protease family)